MQRNEYECYVRLVAMRENVSKTISNTYQNNTMYLLHMQCIENDVRYINGMYINNFKK